jgi:AcrR family transcriptional regulator
VQERSAASVEAILGATIQVLLQLGRERLTTTRVAARAGVSVGTLYQYFPNKSALLRAALQRHLEEIEAETVAVCREQAGAAMETMAAALMERFLAAKMRDTKTSRALYAVSSDVDGAAVVRATGARVHRAIVTMLETAQDAPAGNAALMASMLQAAMTGVSRRLLESAAAERELERLRSEAVFLARSYVRACAAGSGER